MGRGHSDIQDIPHITEALSHVAISGIGLKRLKMKREMH